MLLLTVQYVTVLFLMIDIEYRYSCTQLLPMTYRYIILLRYRMIYTTGMVATTYRGYMFPITILNMLYDMCVQVCEGGGK